uniref:Uncharacterized protein n=1 Tax=Utricularia reniformis TaxID=192314 RepID=A0A1Y0B0Q7_9LAMI|nr:hypothetical protein AEK19_MT0740 [Utricularia reniformis]ART30983.1 hypothetical protein AEK19_MT0740 [Utricularia reniformis]
MMILRLTRLDSNRFALVKPVRTFCSCCSC